MSEHPVGGSSLRPAV